MAASSVFCSLLLPPPKPKKDNLREPRGVVSDGTDELVGTIMPVDEEDPGIGAAPFSG